MNKQDTVRKVLMLNTETERVYEETNEDNESDEDAKEGSIKLRLRNFYLVIVAKTGDLLHGRFPRLN